MENKVENLLCQNEGVKLSLKSISKRLKLKKRYVFFLIKNSGRIRQVDPLEVGSKKKEIMVFTYY